MSTDRVQARRGFLASLFGIAAAVFVFPRIKSPTPRYITIQGPRLRRESHDLEHGPTISGTFKIESLGIGSRGAILQSDGGIPTWIRPDIA